MENPTRKAARAGAAAALLAVGLVVAGAGAASAACAPDKQERITSAEQLTESIKLAAQIEQEHGAVALSGPIGGNFV